MMQIPTKNWSTHTHIHTQLRTLVRAYIDHASWSLDGANNITWNAHWRTWCRYQQKPPCFQIASSSHLQTYKMKTFLSKRMHLHCWSGFSCKSKIGMNVDVEWKQFILLDKLTYLRFSTSLDIHYPRLQTSRFYNLQISCVETFAPKQVPCLCAWVKLNGVNTGDDWVSQWDYDPPQALRCVSKTAKTCKKTNEATLLMYNANVARCNEGHRATSRGSWNNEHACIQIEWVKSNDESRAVLRCTSLTVFEAYLQKQTEVERLITSIITSSIL